MELQVCLPPSFYISLKTYPVFTYINNTPSLPHLPAPLQRVAISKALTQIIKRERVWEKISRIVAAFPLRAFASMTIQEVTSFSPLSSAQPTPLHFLLLPSSLSRSTSCDVSLNQFTLLCVLPVAASSQLFKYGGKATRGLYPSFGGAKTT